MRALEATPENFRSSLESLKGTGLTDSDRLWPTYTPTETIRLMHTLRRGYYTLRADSLFSVRRYDLGNNTPSAARLDLFEPRRFGHNREGIYFFDTNPDSTTEDMAVQGGLQVLEGSHDTGRSRELEELIAEARHQAIGRSPDSFM